MQATAASLFPGTPHAPASLLPFPTAPFAGNAYAARKNSPDKSWQEAAYLDEVAGPAEGENGTGKETGKKTPVTAQALPARMAAPRVQAAPRRAQVLRRSAVVGQPLRAARFAF